VVEAAPARPRLSTDSPTACSLTPTVDRIGCHKLRIPVRPWASANPVRRATHITPWKHVEDFRSGQCNCSVRSVCKLVTGGPSIRFPAIWRVQGLNGVPRLGPRHTDNADRPVPPRGCHRGTVRSQAGDALGIRRDRRTGCKFCVGRLVSQIGVALSGHSSNRSSRGVPGAA